MNIVHKKIKSLMAGTALAIASQASYSAVISLEITNLTHGSYYTPILFTAHSNGTHLFEVGTEASAEIQAMAEGGSIDGLVTLAGTIGASVAENPAGGFLAPGASASVTDWDTGTNTQLSVTAMVLPSNDAFVGLDAWTIPTTAGTYTITLNAYDSGTEANDEIINGGGASGTPGIPGNPGMNGGTGATGVTTTEANDMVHIHRGVLGDTDTDGGVSDLDSRIHRWLNPVARLVITVQ